MITYSVSVEYEAEKPNPDNFLVPLRHRIHRDHIFVLSDYGEFGEHIAQEVPRQIEHDGLMYHRCYMHFWEMS